jgi:DNA-binding SARP family transcriptional activator
MAAENPFRESICRQLMLALYRSECRADALRVYRLTREYIKGELGLEPGPALQDLHRAILAGDAQLLGLSRA